MEIKRSIIFYVFGLIITVYGTTVSDTKYKSAGQLNNGYYVDEQALESLMKKIFQQQENLRRDAKVAKLESILDIEPLTNHYLVDPTHKVLEDLNLFKF